jgi:hypothetical protein
VIFDRRGVIRKENFDYLKAKYVKAEYLRLIADSSAGAAPIFPELERN